MHAPVRPDRLPDITVRHDQPAAELLRALEQALGIALVVNADGLLEGVITDGDVRRFILTHGGLDNAPAAAVIRRDFPCTTARTDQPLVEIRQLFTSRIRQIPILDAAGRPVDLLLFTDILDSLLTPSRQVFRARAPLRVSFAGGGSDIPPFCLREKGCVISTTIGLYVNGTLRRRADEVIRIVSHDYDTTFSGTCGPPLPYDGMLDLPKAVINLLQPRTGFDLTLHGDVPCGTGLGGSAAAALVTAGLVLQGADRPLDAYGLAELAYHAERSELRIPGGWQDQYASAFGGINFIEFKSSGTVVHPLRVRPEILAELQQAMLLCYTGTQRDSGTILQQQRQALIEEDAAVLEATRRMRELAGRMKDLLLRGDLAAFARVLHEAWEYKRGLATEITNEEIDALYALARTHGAIGGKLLGAGGGGYLLLLCPPEERYALRARLSETGHPTQPVVLEKSGLHVWPGRSFSAEGEAL